MAVDQDAPYACADASVAPPKRKRRPRTPAQRAKEREADRARYARLKDNAEHIARRRASRKARRDANITAYRDRERAYYNAKKNDPLFRTAKRRISRQWYNNNVELASGRAKEYRKRMTAEQRQAERALDRRWYAKMRNDPEFLKKNRRKPKIWRAKNPGRAASYYRKRRNTDHVFRALESMRSRLRAVIKRAGASKSDRTNNLIGCSPDYLARHLETMFRDGMTWENYGTIWHVDHIKPCKAFNLGNPSEQAACFHWTNLQPLLAFENLSKSDRYEEVKP